MTLLEVGMFFARYVLRGEDSLMIEMSQDSEKSIINMLNNGD